MDASTPPAPAADRAGLRLAVRKLEAQMLQDMLRSARFGEAPEGFGGGPGEDHFASYLREAVAEKMVARGGTGLSEAIFRAMTDARDG